jgi:hypothetical protein
MLIVAAAALGLTVGGPDFNEAFARARAYSHQPKVRRYVDTVFRPTIKTDMDRILEDCFEKLNTRAALEFNIVISYRNGAPDRVLLKREAPFGRCAAERLTKIYFPPNPPVPDLAEDLDVQIGRPRK